MEKGSLMRSQISSGLNELREQAMDSLGEEYSQQVEVQRSRDANMCGMSQYFCEAY